MKMLSLLALALLSAPAFADQAGFREVSFPVAHREKLVTGALWYPVADEAEITDRIGENAVFIGTGVVQNAPLVGTDHPVVLLSHGLGGNYRTLSWLAAGLAARGAVVVSLDHPDSTTRDFDMRRGLDHGARARDLSAALDRLVQDPDVAGHIDPDRVMAAGFSYGGWSALSLGGLRGNLAGYAAHCAQVTTRSSHCGDIAAAGVDLAALDRALWDQSYRDPRVTMVAAIDPGLTYGLTAADVEALVENVQLIALGDEETRLLATDTSASGSGFEALVPQAARVQITPASHFSALLPCKPKGAMILKEEGDDPVCDGPLGEDRVSIHAKVVEEIARQLGL